MLTAADALVLALGGVLAWLIYWAAGRLMTSALMPDPPRSYSQAETELCDCGALERDEKHYDHCAAASFDRR